MSLAYMLYVLDLSISYPMILSICMLTHAATLEIDLSWDESQRCVLCWNMLYSDNANFQPGIRLHSPRYLLVWKR